MADDPQFSHLGGLVNQKGRNVETPFTEETDGTIRFRDDRPALLISSTSWTEDEDFSVLLSALSKYDQGVKDAVNNGNGTPRLILLITGKGPLKTYYERKIIENDWKHVVVITAWLAAEDYISLLGK